MKDALQFLFIVGLSALGAYLGYCLGNFIAGDVVVLEGNEVFIFHVVPSVIGAITGLCAGIISTIKIDGEL